MKPRIIVVTGSESTGKTELASRLADYYEGLFIPEYSRKYVEKLNRPYDLNDVLKIAEKQYQDLQAVTIKKGYVFFDTWLIITKVWLSVVFNHEEIWINEAIKSSSVDLYLVNDNDLPWIADPVRENGGEMRDVLLRNYINILETYDLPYRIIKGSGKKRLGNAIFAVTDHFK